ncbi:MAG: MEDS domain-containing protein, partial [Acidimicrobiia bacterium]
MSAHICVFYRGAAERDTLLADVFAAGAAARDKCLCIADTADPAPVEGELRRVMGEAATDGQLTVLTTDAYLIDGRFVPDRCVAEWDTLLSSYVAQGYAGIRATADVAGLLAHGVGGPALLDYEARCNGLTRHPATIYCLYDLDRFGPGLVAGVLARHTGAVAGGVLLSAPRAEAVLEPGDRPWQADGGAGQQSLALAQLLLAGATDENEIRELVAQVCAASVDVDHVTVTGGGAVPDDIADLGVTVRYPIAHGGTVLGWLVAGSRQPAALESATGFLSALAVLAGPHLGAARLAAAEFTHQLLDGDGDRARMPERARAFGVDPGAGARV